MSKLLSTAVSRMMNYWSTRKSNQNGVVLPLVAVLLVVLLAFTALAVDVGRYMVVRNELQNIADGAALAACRVLGDIYQNMPSTLQPAYVCDGNEESTIKSAAVNVGFRNEAGGLENIVIRDVDVLIGTWDGNAFTQTPNQPDAVRVIARRDGNANTPITTFFARLVGVDTMDVWMDAIAALTGQSTTEPGELELPIGISSYFYQDGNFCNDFIVFNPTNDPDSCAGWNSYDISPPNDSELRDILNGDPSSPETTAGETVFNFIGGNLSNPTFDSLLMLFKRKGFDTQSDGTTPVQTQDAYDDEGNPLHDEDGIPVQVPVPGSLTADDGDVVPIAEDGMPLEDENGNVRLDDKGDPLTQALYPDGTPRNMHRWETSIVVYDWEDCSNPNTSIVIVGYTRIEMTNVQQAPEKRIEGRILCDLFSEFETRGGGGEFGIKGTIPGLVE